MANYNVYFQEFKNLIDLHHAEAVHSRYAEKWVELTLTHSMFVCEIAFQIIKKLDLEQGIYVDKEFILQAALLHDIGIYKCFDEEFNPDSKLKYLQHGQLGYKIIDSQTGSNSLARIALTHTGFGGITIDEIIKDNLNLEKIDMTQITIEEEIVAWADKFHTKWPRFYSLEEIELQSKKFGEYKYNIFCFYKNKFGVPDIATLKDESTQWHKDFDEFIESISKNDN